MPPHPLKNPARVAPFRCTAGKGKGRETATDLSYRGRRLQTGIIETGGEGCGTFMYGFMIVTGVFIPFFSTLFSEIR